MAANLTKDKILKHKISGVRISSFNPNADEPEYYDPCFYGYDRNGNLTLYTDKWTKDVWFYDESDNLVKCEHYQNDNITNDYVIVSSDYLELEFDEFGNMIEKRVFNDSNELKSMIKYEYSEGKLVMQSTREGFSFEMKGFQYNEFGQLIRESIFFPGTEYSAQEHVYDSSGNKIETYLLKDEENRILKWKWIYDNFGEIMEFFSYNQFDEQIAQKIQYVYENGLVVRENLFIKNELVTSFKYEYEIYDDD